MPMKHNRSYKGGKVFAHDHALQINSFLLKTLKTLIQSNL